MIVIVGAGYAGLSTARALARRGLGARTLILEAEAAEAQHASGRNAGLIMPLHAGDPVMAELAARGASELLAGSGGERGPRPDPPPHRRSGSLQLSSDEGTLETLKRRGREHGLSVEVRPTRELAGRLPVLAGATAAMSVRCEQDAIVEPADLARWFLGEARRGGCRLITQARVTAVETASGRVSAVRTTAGTMPAEVLVNAAGAWAGEVACLAGLDGPRLEPRRRHLFLSAPWPGASGDWPVVWDLDEDVYLREQRGGLLLSPCDQDPHPASPPEVSPEAHSLLMRGLSRALPALAGIRLESARACLRTFAPDGRCLIGPDRRLGGYVWAAGLGGLGATAAAAVGEMTADWIARGEPDERWISLARSFDPSRLVDHPDGG